MKTIRTLRENVVYRNRFVTVFDDDVEFPSGAKGTYFRYRWTAPHGVAIVPVQGNDIILVELYRYSEKSFSIEIPQGFGTHGNDPANDARRELLEETGLETESLVPLLTLGSHFKTHVFAASIRCGAEPHADRSEDTEYLRGFKRLSVTAISPGHLASMGIFDAVTISALLAFTHMN